ncbi:ejaculatory bulb-specific protein 3-like [Fopius arisanus]|uniref:Ejaculatory bulb-specific protein 3-like n=1 Tax=Fopius arisanus TaxID=64838 RepID=A0A0C9QFN9_9HYME|nr:PREDICTED: ejaculatory bulb-specific protein 3-like [Fopius arisanus]
MKIAVFVLFSCLAVISARPETYSSKWDTINVDEILNNDRILTNYVNCLLEKGNCTPEGKELRRILPDALETECAKCTDAQKVRSQKVLKFVVRNKPVHWKNVVEKYDPEKKYVQKYEDEAIAEGFTIDT